MSTFTNMMWPDDPYGTGQLWRKEPQLAASLAAAFVGDGDRAVPVAYSIVYLPLHRTKATDPSNGLSFGFRSVTAPTFAERAELISTYELDTMRARRLAKVLSGHLLADELHGIAALAPGGAQSRGIRALATALVTCESPAGMALLADSAQVLPDVEDLAEVAEHARISTATALRAFEPQSTIDAQLNRVHTPDGPGSIPRSPADLALMRTIVGSPVAEWLAAYCTERALISGLVSLRHLGRYSWTSRLHVSNLMSANLADCFPTQTWGSAFHRLDDAELSAS